MPYRKDILTIIISSILISCSAQSIQDKEYQFDEKTFTLDTSFVAKTSVENIYPCKTTLTDLKKYEDLRPVEVENMEQGKECIGSDARFDNDRGFNLTTNQGIVVQKDQSTEYVSKIHLTKDFEGTLPNGQFISVKDLKVKDVVSIYPEFNYSIRDCSDYWTYNNDTIYFYFLVDETVQKYPLDEEYYANKSIEGIDIVLWCYKMYEPDYSEEVVYERPLYAPLTETHVNAYVLKRREDIETKVKEVTTFGKKTSSEVIKLGKWIEYSPDHQLITEEYYDNKGNLINKVK